MAPMLDFRMSFEKPFVATLDASLPPCSFFTTALDEAVGKKLLISFGKWTNDRHPSSVLQGDASACRMFPIGLQSAVSDAVGCLRAWSRVAGTQRPSGHLAVRRRDEPALCPVCSTKEHRDTSEKQTVCALQAIQVMHIESGTFKTSNLEAHAFCSGPCCASSWLEQGQRQR